MALSAEPVIRISMRVVKGQGLSARSLVPSRLLRSQSAEEFFRMRLKSSIPGYLNESG
jgi:hypothetical protein